MHPKLMILGGYGVFGGRLAELLKDAPVEMLICGRSLDRAQAFCDALQGSAHLTPAAVDRDQITTTLDLHQPDIVVDATGPFQTYGDDPHHVIRACIDHGINYLDFADGADFVAGVSEHDAQSKAAGVFVLSGVSSFPVLSAAVLRVMAKQLDIDSVTAGIAPSPFAGVGLNVMRAVVGYAGSPVKLTRNGKQTTAAGLTESRYYTVSPPGDLPLHNIRFSLVDVPDLQVLPMEHPGIKDIWVGAGPGPEPLHIILNLLAKARARFKLPSLLPAAPLFYRVLNLMRFGEHRGGMFVTATGTQNGQPATISWHLLAEGDDGPLIPSMAIAAVIQKCLDGTPPTHGARPATHALELSDYDHLFKQRTITTGFRHSNDDSLPLYPRLLGNRFASLPPQVQALHNSSQPRQWSGTATITAGTNAITRSIARLFRFPTRNGTCPVTVHFDPTTTAERWTRQFGPQKLTSQQYAGTGRNAHLLVERFGPFAVGLALVIDNQKLRMIPRRWTFLGLPLPRPLLPGGDTFETDENGGFCFHVEICLPLLGRLVKYQGNLHPAAD